ncbi:tetratricopeptide repeat protein [Spirosoma montaniterrae]|uniref:Orc1-like AAA ATPase domain-containing protein n=1 Tax=Spirosoma montaniterrae TaxID=1178516 RepID=A0A1P9X0I1_9BACT|nr:tetratricopeptide repeat protein [Spirosoma montaniterrae]AQG81108.1 hypothetical protein AWR27_18340 [Spirosoma montaniterrae]
MDPLTIGLVTQCLTTTKIAECLIGNWLGKGSDQLLSKAGKVIYERLRTQTQPVNHDIHRAVREAHLNATLVICEHLLRNKYNVADRLFHFPAWDLKEVISYLKKQRKQLSDVKFALPDNPAVTEYELLLQPKGVPASERLAELQLQVRKGMLQELEQANLGIEDDLRTAILTGWTDKGQSMDWFELLCAFFAESLKTNTRLQSVVQTNLLQDVKELLLTVKANVPQISISPEQLTDLAAQLGKAMQPIVDRFDEVMSRLDDMLITLERIENKVDTVQIGVGQANESLTDIREKVDKLLPTSPARQKYLNTFAHYDLTNLVGRTDELSQIDAHFARHDMLLLRGMGGIGKTTLAKAYMARSRDGYDHLAYVEIVGTIADSILIQLGNSPDVAFTPNLADSTDDKFKALIDTLGRIPNLLLVLDNANDADDLRLRQRALESLAGRVLITGRARPQTFVQERKVQEIKKLTPADALQLFKNLYPIPLTDAEDELVKTILEKAFYHPKLIEVLAKAAYANSWLQLTDLRAIVEQKEYRHEAINYPVEVDDQTKAIYRILLDLFDTDRLSDDAQQLLRYFAVLPTIDVPITHLATILRANTPAEQQQLQTSLQELTRLGWLDDTNNRYFAMHGLVQWTMRERLQPTATNCERLLDGMADALYTEPTENPLDKQVYLPYTAEWLTLFANEKNEILARFFNNLARFFNNIAATYRALGQHDERLAYNQNALAIFEAVLPTNHPDLAQSINNIAEAYGALGQQDKRLEYNLKALAIREAVLPANHPDLAQSFNNIAATYYYTGDLGKALDYMQKALTIWERVLPAEHPDLLSSRKSLAVIEQAIEERNKNAG